MLAGVWGWTGIMLGMPKIAARQVGWFVRQEPTCYIYSNKIFSISDINLGQ